MCKKYGYAKVGMRFAHFSTGLNINEDVNLSLQFEAFEGNQLAPRINSHGNDHSGADWTPPPPPWLLLLLDPATYFLMLVISHNLFCCHLFFIHYNITVFLFSSFSVAKSYDTIL